MWKPCGAWGFWEVALRGQSRHLPVTTEVWNAAKEQGRGPGRSNCCASVIVLDADFLILKKRKQIERN